MGIAASPTMASNATQVGERTRRIVGLRLLPFVFILYIVNYIDRTNLAYAALGMSRELGFSDHVFSLGAGVFFVSYLALQIPGALLVEPPATAGLPSAGMATKISHPHLSARSFHDYRSKPSCVVCWG